MAYSDLLPRQVEDRGLTIPVEQDVFRLFDRMKVQAAFDVKEYQFDFDHRQYPDITGCYGFFAA